VAAAARIRAPNPTGSALRPEYLRDGWPQAWSDDDRRHLLTHGMAAYTESGIIGRPSLATEAKGQKALQILGQNAVEVVESLTNGSPGR
jgi:creatinine amidohydrolase